MIRIALAISGLIFLGCSSQNKSCKYQFQQVSGLNKAKICWHSKGELLKDLDTIPDETDKLIESNLIPSGGRITLTWEYDRIGTVYDYMFGYERRVANQPMPMSLILNDGSQNRKCGELVSGYDNDNEETEAIIYCNMSVQPSSKMNISVIDINGFEIAKFGKPDSLSE